MRKPFVLYRRWFKRKNGKKDTMIYYCQFRNEQGRKLTAISTQCTSKTSAEIWAINHLKSGIIPKKQFLTFAQFTKNFWLWDSCEYVNYLRLHGKKISQRHCSEQRRKLEQQILPYFRDIKLSSIHSYDIEKWLSNYQDSGLAVGTINGFLQIIKTVLQEAKRRGIISTNPANEVSPLSGKSKVRGILTPEEVKLLLSELALSNIWKNDLQIYTINMLACTSGLRLGECLGLQFKALNPGYLEITSSWERFTKSIKSTKTNKDRFVTIPGRVEENIYKCIELLQYREPEDLIFVRPYSKRGKPIDHLQIQFGLINALHAIGIDEETRKRRNISFHGWRHFFNSFLRVNQIQDAKIRELTGHSSLQMQERYSHFRVEDFADIQKLQDKLLE